MVISFIIDSVWVKARSELNLPCSSTSESEDTDAKIVGFWDTRTNLLHKSLSPQHRRRRLKPER